jgi:hypothetical protein
MQSQNHTKEYSIAVILHAVARVKFDGGIERDVANLIGVDPSNIPKYKDGSSKLSPTNIRILLEHYGPPTMTKGKYLKAHLINTVFEYVRTFEVRANHQLICELGSLFSGQQMIMHLTDCIAESVLETTAEDEEDEFRIKFSFRRCSEDNRQAVLDWLIHQVKTPAFQQWSSKYEDAICTGTRALSAYQLPALKDFDDVWKATFVADAEQPLLYLFGHFVNTVGTKADTLSEMLAGCKPEAKQEVVVTGDVVLDLQVPKRLKNAPKVAVVFNQVLSLLHRANIRPTDYEYSDFASKLTSLREFSQVSAEVTLHINDRMMYRILVEECWGKNKNSTVIRDVRQDLVIDQFNQLAEFYGCGREHEDQLKSAIALRGGYIPGATML